MMSLSLEMKPTKVQLINFLEKNFPKLTQIVLTVFFLYMVSMMVVMGNGASFLGRYLSPYYVHVANTVGLNTTWNFFSPDPANTMYIRINYRLATGDDLDTVLPEVNEDGVFDFSLNKRRMAYVVRYLILDPQKIEEFLAPWLCRQKPEARSIYIETVIEKIPPLDKVIILKDTIFNDLIEKQTINSLDYECPQNKAGES